MSVVTERIYSQVKSSVVGWLLYEKLEWFERIYGEMLLSSRVQHPRACELGVFYGMSAIAQGLLIKEIGLNCKLYAVDAWNAAACSEGSNSQANTDWWNKQDFEGMYLSFLKSIKDFGLEDIVIPIRGRSIDVFDKIPSNIDLMHQDSNHASEIILQELSYYAPNMRKGGTWICDDSKWVEAQAGYAQMPNFDFELIHEHDKDGQSFSIYHKK